MFLGFWNTAKANKENIFYTILTVFLLERVRRGWNRIEARGRAHNLPVDAIERRQQWFAFRAALLYALLFLLPAVKYIYRSVGELSEQVAGLTVLSNLWALAVVTVVVEALLAIVLYNLLGIYVERMNAALGFFRKMGRSVVDGSVLAMNAGRARVQAGASASVRAGESVGRGILTGARMIGAGLAEGTRRGAGVSVSAARQAPRRLAGLTRRVGGTARRVPGRVRRGLVSQLNIIK